MQRTSPRQAVVFDLDGTLLDSLSLVLQALGHALAPYGPAPTMQIFPRLGGPPERFIRELVADPRHVPVVVERMAEFHRTHGHRLKPFPGVRPMLERLRARGVPLGLWTGRDRHSADWLLGQHGLAGFFGAIVCGDDLPTHKPDPEGLRRILDRLGTTPGEALLVGDSDVDVLGGTACGVATLLIAAREVDAAVRTHCWQVAASPEEAYTAVLARVEAGGANSL